MASRTAPQDAPGARTRERLLDVAERLFARRGYAATSVRQITAEAACNLAAINYHFGGKHNLYREVFRRRLASMREARIASIRRALAGSRGRRALDAVLAAFANTFLEPLVGDSFGRRMVELWSREMLDPELPPEMFADEIIGPVQDALSAAMIEVVRGLSREKARLCVASLVGQLVHVAVCMRSAQVTGSMALGLLPLRSIVAHIVRFSAAGVRAYARDGR